MTTVRTKEIKMKIKWKILIQKERKQIYVRMFYNKKKIIQIPKNVPSYEVKICAEQNRILNKRFPWKNNEMISFNIAIILRLSHHVVL